MAENRWALVGGKEKVMDEAGKLAPKHGFALGVDPGKTGATVLVKVTGESVSNLTGPSVFAAAWWYWRPSQGKAGGWLVDSWSADDLEGVWDFSRRRRSNLTMVGRDVVSDARLLGAQRVPVALEGLYSGKGSRARGGSIVALCEAAGEMLGAVRDLADGEVMRPTYTQWVAKVMPPAHGKPSSVAQPYIMANVHRVVGGIGGEWPDHVADAACLAYWAAVKSGQVRRKG